MVTMFFSPGRYSEMKKRPEMSELAMKTFRLPNALARGFENGNATISATVPMTLNNWTLSSLPM